VTAGGALMTTTEVENYPGFPDGALGPDLMQAMRAQAVRFGAELIADDVTALDLVGATKTATDSEGTRYRSRSVVLAMGAAYRKLGIPAEEKYSGRGVSWCATCDGFFYRGKRIAVVGGGDSALEEAIFLTRFAEHVTLIHRRDALRGSRIMAERALGNPKIEFAWNSTVVDMSGDSSLQALTLRNTKTGETSQLEVAGLFEAIGHEPRSELVRGQVAVDAAGYVVVEPTSQATDVSGVFACGDLVDHTYRQAITAAGSGCRAAQDVGHFLESAA
jgi:thioredoxin reductase (NADPH)